MRTTISLEDNLGAGARQRARDQGLSLSGYVARLVAADLAREDDAKPPPFRLITVGGGGPLPGIDLDRTSALLVREDEEAYAARRRPRRRKP